MRKLFKQLWADDVGFIVSVELLFLAVILVIGLTAGWAALRVGVVSELGSVGNAVSALDDGYFVDGLTTQTGGSNSTAVTHTPIVTTISVKTAATPQSDEAFGGGSGGPPNGPPAP